MKRWLTNMSFRRKLTVVFFPIILLIIVTITTINLFQSYQNIKTRTEESVIITNQQISEKVSSIFFNSKTALDILTNQINDTIFDDTGSTVALRSISLQNKLLTVIDTVNRSFDDISSILYINENSEIMVQSGKLSLPDRNILQKEIISQIPLDKSPSLIYFPLTQYQSYNNQELLLIGRRLININNGENLGYIFIIITQEKIKEVLPTFQDNNNYNSLGNYYLVNNQNIIITSRDAKEIGEKLNQKNAIVNYHAINLPNSNHSNYKISVVNITRYQSIYRELKQNLLMTVIIGFFFIATSGILISILSKIISTPVSRLKNAMELVKLGELDTKIQLHPESKDEIGILTENFNAMVTQLEESFINIKKEQNEKKEYELSLITAQLKPHFLYNTLDLAYVLSSMNRSKAAGEVVKALALFYKTSLSNGKEIVTINEEKINIENYLYIQQIRYSDKLSFSIDIAEEIFCENIPKLTLQPIVENAIYHGLRENKDIGVVKISGKVLDQDIIVLTVSDNGKGISEEIIKAINTHSYEELHFGLKSVNERIRIYFGKEFGIKIKRLTVGTEVNIYLPRKRGGSNAEIDIS